MASMFKPGAPQVAPTGCRGCWGGRPSAGMVSTASRGGALRLLCAHLTAREGGASTFLMRLGGVSISVNRAHLQVDQHRARPVRLDGRWGHQGS